MIHFRLIIMRIDVQPNLDLLQLGGVVMLARLAIPFFLLVLELAEINDAADRRGRVGRHLDQIKTALLRGRQRLAGGHYPELFSVRSNHPHFTCANLLVNTNKLLNWRDLLWPGSGLAWLMNLVHNDVLGQDF